MVRMLASSVSLLALFYMGCGGAKATDPSSGTRPVAVASAEPATVEPGQQVTLRGGASTDPGGGGLVFHWGQASSNPLPVEFSTNDSSGASSVQVTLQAPGRYSFVLRVENEQAVLSLPDSVVVTVRSPNRVPAANAGNDQTVQAGATVQLDGSGSSDPDHDTLTYRWTASPQLTLSDATAVRPHFIPSAEGTYILTLVVSDGQLSSAPDQVAVVVEGSGFAEPTFSQVQQQVFTPSCALSGCHADADHPILRAGQAYGNLVGVASSVGLILVTPGDPDRSYLYIKITGGPGMVGSRMPRGRGALSAANLAVVRDWIARGAPND